MVFKAQSAQAALPASPLADSEPLAARRASKVKYIYRLLRPGDIGESLTSKTVRRAGDKGRRYAACPAAACSPALTPRMWGLLHSVIRGVPPAGSGSPPWIAR